MANESETPAMGPDWALLANRGMADGGPRYTETPTATAALFILIVAVWVWRLRGRYREYPFLCCCLPILLAGGIGGTLYHATRTSFTLFLLDVVPISILGLAGAVFMAIRYWGPLGWWFVPGATAFYIGVNRLLFTALDPGQTLAVNLSYASLAIVILTPIGLVLVRTQFRHGSWIVAGFIAFVIAWCFRLVDRHVELMLPMGSHWLWHTFGAIATAFLIEYFFRVEGERR
jgi:hypothetical protein